MQVLQALLVRPRQVALRLQGTRVDTATVAAVNEPLANLVRIKPRRAAGATMAKHALAGSAAGRVGWKVLAQYIAAPCSALDTNKNADAALGRASASVAPL